jgi:hypothetical protein
MTTKLTARQQDKLIEAAQNAIQFVVEGSGDFPLDMLRYDRCWPAHADDASRINPSRVAGRARERQIGLCGLKPPTVGRWASFGWKVVA